MKCIEIFEADHGECRKRRVLVEKSPQEGVGV